MNVRLNDVATAVVGQIELLDRSGIRTSSIRAPWLLLLALATMAVVGSWLLIRFAGRRGGRAYVNPLALFRELCRVHGLNTVERRLLLALAAERGCDQPATLFVAPHCFQVETLGAAFERDHEQIRALHARLFGNLA